MLKEFQVSYQIKIFGSLDGQEYYQAQHIQTLLQNHQTTLQHGQTFTGRPTTKIHCSEHDVLKLRTELQFDLLYAERWVKQTLEKEQSYGVHPPQKTWFLAFPATDARPIIGNVCPRLMPLHEVFNQLEAYPERCLPLLNKMVSLYFDSAQHLRRLDEGLSNFAIDAEENIYYLDDDIYIWDKFLSFAHMLGVYFRSLKWLDGEIATQFGHDIQHAIIQHFADIQYISVLAEQLRDVFIPAENRRLALTHFIQALENRQTHTTTPPLATSTPATAANPLASSESENTSDATLAPAVITTTPRPLIPLENNRYLALLADIHGNITALETVFDFLTEQAIEHAIVLGDIVGYGPYPSECIQRIQDSGFTVIKGNHDHGLATGKFDVGFSKSAAWALNWSLPHVSQAQRDWLLNLPPVLHHEHWLAVHGAPIDPTFFNAYVYHMTYSDNLDVLARKKIPLCFHGHSHQTLVHGRQQETDKVTDGRDIQAIDLTPYDHALICPGSIGQPRNQRSGAHFAIYDQQERTVHYHMLRYDTLDLFAKLEEQQFPEMVKRLFRV